MPIRMMQTGNGAAPVVICDHCGEMIEKSSEGNYEWINEDDTPGSHTEVFFLHKKCSRAHEQQKGTHLASEELDVLVPFLMSNLKVNMEWAQKLATAASEGIWEG